MLFNSIDFAIFLPIFFVIYWLTSKFNIKAQNKSFFGYTNNSHPTCVNANAVKKRISFFFKGMALINIPKRI
tara:strand:+ start:377 stop:592 length:216 start_codon:yes stop_codon:yes gene_type:complete